ncbi:peptidyl-tRNA hydrolase [Blastocladiella britannica]|nr:peptidyl-tRNA hydrolase [Blastocladiella britannica]
MAFVIGLGNHGTQYRTTRHNVGALSLELLASELGLSWTTKSGYDQAICSRAALNDLVGNVPPPPTADSIASVDEIRLIRLRTFMNVSGAKFRNLLRAESIATSAFSSEPAPGPPFLFVHDDLDKPPGTLTFRVQGSAAGHNGIRSVQALLGTDKFARIRVGVGRPSDRNDVADYVLHSMPGKELQTFKSDIAPAVWGMMGDWLSNLERGLQVKVPGTIKV